MLLYYIYPSFLVRSLIFGFSQIMLIRSERNLDFEMLFAALCGFLSHNDQN